MNKLLAIVLFVALLAVAFAANRFKKRMGTERGGARSERELLDETEILQRRPPWC